MLNKSVLRLVMTALAISLLVAACASTGPEIAANVNPSADFRAFSTYNYIQPLGTDREDGTRTPLSSRLMASMDREMALRGLELAEEPDILVDFVISIEDRVSVRQTPTHAVHRSHWSHGWNTWPAFETTVRQYSEGSLVIDLIAREQGMLVAEGGFTKRLNNNPVSQERADELVGAVMQQMWAN